MFNWLIEKLNKIFGGSKRKNYYKDEARKAAEAGQPFRHLLEAHARQEIDDFKKSGVVTGVKILTAQNACPECKQHDGETYTLDEALRLMPIPHLECTFQLNKDAPGWCRCVYISIASYK